MAQDRYASSTPYTVETRTIAEVQIDAPAVSFLLDDMAEVRIILRGLSGTVIKKLNYREARMLFGRPE